VRPAKRVVRAVGPADVDDFRIHPRGLRCSWHGSSLPLVFDAWRKPRRQRAACLVEPGLDGPDRDPEFQRGLGVGEPLPVEGEYGRPLARCQRGDGLPYPPGYLGGFSLLRWAGLSIGVLGGQWPGRHLPEPAAGQVQRDPRVPGAELIRGAQPPQTDQGRDSGLLGDVGDEVISTEQPAGQGHDHAPIPVSQAGESILAPRAGGSDQRRVVKGSEIRHAL
jgi:hypothetical protein